MVGSPSSPWRNSRVAEFGRRGFACEASHAKAMHPSPLDVSVVIPVRNDPEGVDRVLRCLERQTLPTERFEVIVSDDGSDPGLVPRPASSRIRVRTVQGPPSSSYAARNRGASLSRAVHLAFCDSDCRPEPTWLEQALDGPGLVRAGEVRPLAPDRPNIWSMISVDMFLDQARCVRRRTAVTANLIVSRDLFLELRGFDEALPSGGDFEFVRRVAEAGHPPRHVPRSVVGHPTLNRGRDLLHKVWFTNRWGATRSMRDGDPLETKDLLLLVPILGAALARSTAERPTTRLHAPRLLASGLRVRWWQHLQAMALVYGPVSIVAGSARLWGGLDGLWRRQRSERPAYLGACRSDGGEAGPDSNPRAGKVCRTGTKSCEVD